MQRRNFLATLGLLWAPKPASAWGIEIHSLATRVALAQLPKDMPTFFSAASRQLQFLSGEPDVWRDRDEVAAGGNALNVGHDSDHIFKFEHYNPEALPPNRFDWLEDLRRLSKDPRKVGTLPYRSVELFQRVRVSFRRLQRTQSADIETFLKARIIEDAGLLSHYIADSSMPMHMSINRNGWEEAENPEEFTRDNTFHSRFETQFAKARVSEAIIAPYVRPMKIVGEPLPYIYAHMRRSWDTVRELYRLEKKRAFTKENDSPEHIEFCARRLADAASSIRDLWYTAYATARPAAQ